MRLLTEHERIALRTYGPPDEGPVPDEVFAVLAARGYGRWVRDPEDGESYWEVTPAGTRALELDTLARSMVRSVI